MDSEVTEQRRSIYDIFVPNTNDGYVGQDDIALVSVIHICFIKVGTHQ